MRYKSKNYTLVVHDMKYTQLIFSPTGGTRKAAEMVTAEWSPSVENIDLGSVHISTSTMRAKKTKAKKIISSLS